jgi:hypothetical protein
MKQVHVVFSPEQGASEYTYYCPADLHNRLQPGDIVVVPAARGLSLVIVTSTEWRPVDERVHYKQIIGKIQFAGEGGSE